MNYSLIKGTFHVVGFSPDGDSIRFKAKNKKLWDKLKIDASKSEKNQFDEDYKSEKNKEAVQLRLQGVDSLETHYGGFSQRADLGQDAAEALIKFLGVKNKLEWQNSGGKKTVKLYDPEKMKKKDKKPYVGKFGENIEGYIVSGELEPHGRPLAWVFQGKSNYKDGASLSEDVLSSLVDKSANYHLLKNGFVYPFFFSTLSGKLRKKLSGAAKTARDNKSNIWKYNQTNLKKPTIKMIQEEITIFPDIFRRIITGSKVSKNSSINRIINLKNIFTDDKGEPRNPRVFVTSTQDFVRLNEVVVVDEKGEAMKINKDPWDIVFLS